MKFSEKWLREWIDPGVDAHTLGARLTMAGLELDSIEAAAPDLSGVVVAKIVAIQPHPDAGKLQVCQVSTGAATKQVVCGAPNARAGLVTALATEGTVLPNGVKISVAELRGVTSQGMLCAAGELGLDEHSAGIIELDQDLPPGEPLMQALDLDDKVFAIDLTPNRSDCLSIEGMAREVSALYQQPVNAPAIEPVKHDIDDQCGVEVKAGRQCPRYCGRIIRHVNAGAATPVWLRERLRRSGIRSINIIVDICNYVMLELGQPMHAFDLDTISDNIVVRLATAQEQLRLLDGRQISLHEDNLIIADSKRALALAGIMGGEHSAVQAATGNIFLESAYFDPLAIIGKARRFGLHTESSHRFERGVDVQLAKRALRRASQLVKQYAGGAGGPVTEVVDSAFLPQPKPVSLTIARVSKLLGAEVALAEAAGLLKNLCCRVEQVSAHEISVTPPSYRFDLQIEVDLIEEIARLKGYHELPAQALPVKASIAGRQNRTDIIYAIKQNLVACGYHEALTFSFIESSHCHLFFEGRSKALANPISSQLSDMRTSLWPGLCAAANYNLKRQHASIKLFEAGRKYLMQAHGLQQIEVIAGVAVGEARPRQWSVAARALDFYDVKGDLARLFAKLELSQKITCLPAEKPGLHPGRTAEICCAGRALGVLGVLHPQAAQALDLPRHKEVVVFELKIDEKLLNLPKTAFQAWSRFPQVRRDLSLIVAAQIPAGQLLNEIYSLQIKELQDIVIFSVYQGEGIPPGLKSVSLGLILQAFSSTLTERQIARITADIISHLANTFNAKLRSG